MQFPASERLSWAETGACLYLLAPLLAFFLLFVSIPFAVITCGFVGFAIWEMGRRTDWSGILVSIRMNIGIAVLAATWLLLSGFFGGLAQSSDWIKHYAILNFLARNPDGLYVSSGNEILRYSIGWYLMPSLALHYTNVHWQTLIGSLWSFLGLFLFFRLLVDQCGGTPRDLLAPVVFALFSGVDILGSQLTGFHQGPPGHLEWWAGWVEYASSTTSLAWVHQHALPAWLMTALLMKQVKRPTLLPYLALLFSTTLLWSPFVVMGLVPFGIYLSVRQGWGRILMDWRTWCAIGCVALPVVVYLTAGAQRIPQGFIWKDGCVWEQPSPCFGWSSYAQFVALEFLAIWVILLTWRPARGGFLLVAGVSLLLIPLYRIGLLNDFGMRVSIPALAVLAILAGRLVSTAPGKHAAAMLAVLAVGAVTPAYEVWRAFHDPTSVPVEADLTQLLGFAPQWRPQYLATPPTWLMRSPR